MNDNVQKWVDALRSGEFAQTTQSLRTGEGYCCLGVACEVYRRETGNGEWTYPDADAHEGEHMCGFRVEGDFGPEVEFLGLPNPVREWFGVRDTEGVYRVDEDPYARTRTLSADNDGGLFFGRIAEIIESEPEELFEP